MWKSAGWLARHYGVSRITIGNWIRDGRFERVARTAGGHYRVWFSEDAVRIGYVRVSSAKQKSSLTRQSEIIRRAYPDIEVVSDIGSRFNFKRRGLRSLLERCLRGDAVEIVVTTTDRLAGPGFPLIKWAVELHGGKITALEEGGCEEEFDPAELIRFITSFLASYHGKRSECRKKGQNLPGK